MKKQISVLLITLLLICTVANSSVYASDSYPIEPYYVGTSQITLSLDLNSTSLGADLAECFAIVMLYDGYSADVTLNLQRSSDKTNWKTIKSWEGSGEEEIRIDEEYFVVNGYYYRVGVLVYVYYENGNLAEIITKYSPIQP